MAHIRIDYDGLMQQVSSIASILGSYESLNSRLKDMKEKVDAGWEGEASRAFAEIMQKYIQQSQKMEEIIGEFKGYASKATASFQEVDQRCAALIRNSF